MESNLRGSEPVKTIITEYAAHHREIRYIRDQVFLIEQNISREDEYDDRDHLCMHSLVLEDDKAIATGRIDAAKDGKIGRVAVLKQFRRRGVGTLIMNSLVDYARELRLPSVWFNAQLTAVPFYLQLGYKTVGPEFEEANIVHVRMEKAIESLSPGQRR